MTDFQFVIKKGGEKIEKLENINQNIFLAN